MTVPTSLMFGKIKYPQPELPDGERVVVRVRVNWSRRGLARRGTLVITEHHVIFQPNSVEAGLGLAPAVWSLSVVRRVDVARRTLNPFSGGLRRRLRIDAAGSDVLFVVPDVDVVADQLHRLLRRPNADQPQD